MESYADFASVYDQFMEDVPYEDWCKIIVNELLAHGIKDGLVLDLGCGTGTMTELLAARGYDMIGVDNAVEMLNIACGKKEKSGHDILYLNQDMREFELYGTVRAVVCVCDSINYLLDEEDLITCFKLVNNYLDPDGIFLFDFNTRYKYETVIGDSVIAENREDCSFIWENFFDAESCINEYDLTVFVKNEEMAVEGKELFSRFQEVHLQRGYVFEEMKLCAEKAGLICFKAFDADTLGEVTDKSERIYMMMKSEEGKTCQIIL